MILIATAEFEHIQVYCENCMQDFLLLVDTKEDVIGYTIPCDCGKELVYSIEIKRS